MDKELLRKIGLTEGEIRVYIALAKIGKSSTGLIMEKSSISSSKIYLILEKLIQKGMVSFVIENNVKKFNITNPKSIIEYVEKKQKELEETKDETEKFVTELTKSLKKYEEESAQIYKGLPGLRVAFQNIIDELNKGEEYLFFSISNTELNEKTSLFFQNLHAKRLEKGIIVKGIIDINWKEDFLKTLKKRKNYYLKFSKLTLPSGITIGKNRILMTLWEDNPIAFEIISKRLVEKYKEFFYKLWNKIN